MKSECGRYGNLLPDSSINQTIISQECMVSCSSTHSHWVVCEIIYYLNLQPITFNNAECLQYKHLWVDCKNLFFQYVKTGSLLMVYCTDICISSSKWRLGRLYCAAHTAQQPKNPLNGWKDTLTFIGKFPWLTFFKPGFRQQGWKDTALLTKPIFLFGFHFG